MGLPVRLSVGKTLPGVETYWISAKEKFQGLQFVRKGILTVFVTWKEPSLLISIKTVQFWTVFSIANSFGKISSYLFGEASWRSSKRAGLWYCMNLVPNPVILLMWKPYPSHHNGLFSPLLVPEISLPEGQIKIGVIRTVRDFLPFLCNFIFLLQYNLLSNIRVCVFIRDPFRDHNIRWRSLLD